MAASDIPDLINSIHQALVDIALPTAEGDPSQRPAVSIKKSVTAEALTCLDCGQHQKMLKRHLRTAHGLTVDDYRAKWGLPSDYPMVAPAYAKTRSQLAMKIGLGRKKPAADPQKSDPAETTETPRNHYPPSRWSRSKA